MSSETTPKPHEDLFNRLLWPLADWAGPSWRNPQSRIRNENRVICSRIRIFDELDDSSTGHQRLKEIKFLSDLLTKHGDEIGISAEDRAEFVKFMSLK